MRTPLPHGDRWFSGLLTERCRIGRLRPRDAPALGAYRSDPAVAMFQDWTTPFSVEDAAHFIAAMESADPLTPGEWFQFAIVERTSDRLAGDVALHRHEDDPSHLTVGYTLARDFWGHGLATEAVGATLEHAIALTGARRVTADALAANEPSLRLLRRLGFAEVARRDRVEQIDGVWHDEVHYELAVQPPEAALGAVLVGGASKRMGSPKALVDVSGASMFAHVTGALEAAGLDIVVSGSGPTPEHHHLVIPDDDHHEGPAAGIAGLLEHAAGRTVFVTAVDQPYLAPPTIRRLLANKGVAVVPDADGTLQVTCAVYRPAFVPELKKAAGRPVRSVAEAVATRVTSSDWRAWGEDGRSWRSLDTPEMLRAALEEFGPPTGLTDV